MEWRAGAVVLAVVTVVVVLVLTRGQYGSGMRLGSPELPWPRRVDFAVRSAAPEGEGGEREFVQAWWDRVRAEGRHRRWPPDTLVVATPHCRHVEWLELQYRALEKYSAHPFYLVVANDADRESQWYAPLQQFCETHERAWHLPIPPETRAHRDVIFPNTVQKSLRYDAVSGRNSVAAQAAWAVVSHHRGYVALWDEDVIPFDSFDLGVLLKDRPALGHPQSRTVEYLWIAFFLADGKRLRDLPDLQWECGLYQGHQVDAGGWSAEWLARHTQDVTLVVNQPQFHLPRHSQMASDLKNQRLLEKYVDAFLHYRGGSEWSDEKPGQSRARRKRFFKALVRRLASQ